MLTADHYLYVSCGPCIDDAPMFGIVCGGFTPNTLCRDENGVCRLAAEVDPQFISFNVIFGSNEELITLAGNVFEIADGADVFEPYGQLGTKFDIRDTMPNHDGDSVYSLRIVNGRPKVEIDTEHSSINVLSGLMYSVGALLPLITHDATVGSTPMFHIDYEQGAVGMTEDDPLYDSGYEMVLQSREGVATKTEWTRASYTTWIKRVNQSLAEHTP